MIITATEFKSNMGKYFELVSKEEIIITRNGKRIARLVDASGDRTDIVASLKGILPPSVTVEEAKKGRLDKYDSID